jgi:hypothetical protein
MGDLNLLQGGADMNRILKIGLGFIVAVFIAGCATSGTIHVPEKYALGNQLEEVKYIWKTRIIDWEDVDNQSLIIQTAPSEYYLIVLITPTYELPFRNNRIWITHTNSRIKAGLDNVVIYNSANIRSSYPIDRIYKINGMEQMRAVRDQLRGKTDNEGDGKTRKNKTSDSLSKDI